MLIVFDVIISDGGIVILTMVCKAALIIREMKTILINIYLYWLMCLKYVLSLERKPKSELIFAVDHGLKCNIEKNVSSKFLKEIYHKICERFPLKFQ